MAKRKKKQNVFLSLTEGASPMDAGTEEDSVANPRFVNVCERLTCQLPVL